MNKHIITDAQLKSYVNDICRQIAISDWRPDYVVGISRGGLVPAVMISHYLNIPMKPLQVSLRDGGECVSDCGMAEDALGYPKQERFVEKEDDVGAVLEAAMDLLDQGNTFKNILIVDDINDTGATFNWIMKDWPSSCLPNDEDWKWVWNNNVRFAVIVDNVASKCEVKMDFVGMTVNKAEKDVWIEFPYEEWWTK
jgi:hypoxanthine phosphoribosyltransferase